MQVAVIDPGLPADVRNNVWRECCGESDGQLQHGADPPVIVWTMARSRAQDTPEKTASYESMVKLAAHRAMKGAGLMAFPVALSLVVMHAIPKSWSKRKQDAALAGTERPTTKPDADNVAKAIADACNGVVWVDDAQVVELRVSKRYSATPGVMVEVRPA